MPCRQFFIDEKHKKITERVVSHLQKQKLLMKMVQRGRSLGRRPLDVLILGEASAWLNRGVM